MMNLHADSPHPLFQYFEKSVIILEKDMIIFIYINLSGRFGRFQFCVWGRFIGEVPPTDCGVPESLPAVHYFGFRATG